MVQLALTSLLGFLALLQPTTAAPQRNVGASDTTTCVADGKLYYSGRSYKMFGGSYIVRCAKDSTGQTSSSQSVTHGGFSVCVESCERTKGCGGFSYVGSEEAGTCYFKSDVGGYTTASDDLVSCWKDPNGDGGEPEPVPSSRSSSHGPSSTGSSTHSSVFSSSTWAHTSHSSSGSVVSSSTTHASYTSAATPTSPAAGQCQQAIKTYGDVYRSGKGSAYQLECGEDHYGGDLTSVGSKTFLGCVDICNAKPECIGYAYTPETCFLKKFLTGTKISAGVDFAINIDRNSTAKPGPSTTASAPSSTSPTVKPAAKTGSCAYFAANDAKTYTDANNAKYTIQCGTDHNGGELGRANAKDFVGCMDACDKKDKCIAFAWTGGNGPGTCYLKGSITKSEPHADVDYAYKDAATYIPASSSTWGFPSSTESGGVHTVTVTSYTSSATPSITSVSSWESYTSSATPSSPSTKEHHHDYHDHPHDHPHHHPHHHHSHHNPHWIWTRFWPHHHPKSHHYHHHHTKSEDEHHHHTKSHHHHPHHTTHTESTATDYVSESSTLTNWVTSVSPSSTPSGIPTRTYTKQPIMPTSVGDKAYCDELRTQKPKKLRAEVLHGDWKFNHMWVQDPTRSKF